MGRSQPGRVAEGQGTCLALHKMSGGTQQQMRSGVTSVGRHHAGQGAWGGGCQVGTRVIKRLAKEREIAAVTQGEVGAWGQRH